MRLNASFRADLEWWYAFVSKWNGVALLQGVELEKERGKVEVWTDASGLWGCGALWDGKGLQVAWSEWPSFGSANISAKGGYLGLSLEGRVVVCHYDNQVVVAALRGGYCREMDMAFLLRCLFFFEARYDLVWQARFILGVENSLADSISRNRLDVLFDLYPQVCRTLVRLNLEVVRSLVLERHRTSDTWRNWLASL